MDAYEQSTLDRFWHDGTRMTLAKARWKNPCAGLWKRPDPVLIWYQGYVCAFLHRKKIKLDEMTAYTVEECQPWWPHSHRWHRRGSGKRFLNPCSWLPTTMLQAEERGTWTSVPDWQQLAAVWEGKEDCGDNYWFPASWWTCYTDFQT